MKEKKTILITALGASNAESVVKCLENYRNKFKIIGTDIYPAHAVSYADKLDQFFQVPPARDSGYVPAIEQILQEVAVDYLIPVFDLEVEKLSKYKSCFANRGTIICSADHNVVQLCNDKESFSKFCNENGYDAIPVLEQKDWEFPLFVKPRSGNGSVNCFEVYNEEELNVFLNRLIDPIVQPLYKGEKYVVDFLCDENGKMVDAVARIELESKSGNGIKVIIDQKETILGITRQLVEEIKYKGLGNLEFFYSKNKFTIIELNPRVSSGIIFTKMAGSNQIAKMLNLMGENLEIKYAPFLNHHRFHRTWQEKYMPHPKHSKDSPTRFPN